MKREEAKVPAWSGWQPLMGWETNRGWMGLGEGRLGGGGVGWIEKEKSKGLV